MEDFITVLLTIYYIAVVVLGVWMFCKMWKLCNDVAALKDHLLANVSTKTLLLHGDKAAAAPRMIAKATDRMAELAELAELNPEKKDALYEKMDKRISGTKELFAIFELGDLPKHLQNREQFLEFYEALQKH